MLTTSILHRLRSFTCLRTAIRAYSPAAIQYVQGQSPEPKVREYFYYIDHEGMLFLDDARLKNFTSCFKDKQFLQFFFKRLKRNDTKRYRDDFPYLSICGRERNFIRCDDFPIVFTAVIPDEQDATRFLLTYAHCANLLTVPFEPQKIYMSPETGRVYHPAAGIHGSIGLIRSKLSIELSQHFEFLTDESKSPTHCKWNGVRYELDTSWLESVEWTPGDGRHSELL